jgi:hypothetical protein
MGVCASRHLYSILDGHHDDSEVAVMCSAVVRLNAHGFWFKISHAREMSSNVGPPDTLGNGVNPATSASTGVDMEDMVAQ